MLVILFLLSQSCQKNTINELTHYELPVLEKLDFEIAIVDSLQKFSSNMDLVPVPLKETFCRDQDMSYIITFINVSCVTCLADFEFWNRFFESTSSKKVKVYYVVHSNDRFNFFKYVINSGKIEINLNSVWVDENEFYNNFYFQDYYLYFTKSNIYKINKGVKLPDLIDIVD
ncbi:hypothetical protein SAMN04488057_12811 [Cyclobacterium lianum]|uniref:Uncharacterized protein n=2 Tax=Cyclobacterium lianum TaxID=388280 RepID=A0A1M7QUQ1_9BACT|nr:hypothetical protein SAMN04488057_12811 [Cyclobacterium lianum]